MRSGARRPRINQIQIHHLMRNAFDSWNDFSSLVFKRLCVLDVRLRVLRARASYGVGRPREARAGPGFNETTNELHHP